MKISKLVIACWAIGVILIIFGTATEKYTFEIFAVLMFVFGYVLADWDHLFPKQKKPKE